MTSTESTSRFATILAELSDPFAQVDSIRHDHNVYQLATPADCYSPDGDDSPGARFLAGIARGVAEHVDTDDMGTLYDLTNGDGAHEIADSAVPIYTHDRWQTFVDLGAYNEDPTDFGADGSDMTQTAGVALYLIARRLVVALAEELSAALDEDADADEDVRTCEACDDEIADDGPVTVDGKPYHEHCAPEPADA